MNVTPATAFTASLDGAPTGLTGTLGVRILRASDDAVVLARTTAGIAEAVSGSGVYEVQLTSPAAQGDYLIVWDTGATSPTTTVTEELTVTGARPASVDVPGPPAVKLVRLPQANATLLEVRTRGVVEDWDVESTTAARWSGLVDAYVMGANVRTSSGQNSSEVLGRRVILPSGCDVRVGDTLTLSQQGSTYQLTAREVVDNTPPPGIAGTMTVTAEDA